MLNGNLFKLKTQGGYFQGFLRYQFNYSEEVHIYHCKLPMMNEMLLTTLVSTVTAVSGFIYGFQKNKKDLISQSLNNLQQQITIYQDVISSLRGEIEHLISKVNEQEKIICSLEKKIDGLKPKVKTKVIE